MTAYALPTMTFQRTSFQLRYLNTPPIRSRGGGVSVVAFGDSYWECLLTTPAGLTTEQVLALQAWFDRLQGGIHTFLAHDEAMPWPSNYPTGFGALGGFTGIAATSALSAYAITVTGLPASFVLKTGDYLGLVQGGKYSLHRIVGPVTANGSGVAASVPVIPAIKTTIFTTSAQVNLSHPLAEFVPDVESWSGEPLLRFAPGIQVSFGGISRVA